MIESPPPSGPTGPQDPGFPPYGGMQPPPPGGRSRGLLIAIVVMLAAILVLGTVLLVVVIKRNGENSPASVNSATAATGSTGSTSATGSTTLSSTTEAPETTTTRKPRVSTTTSTATTPPPTSPAPPPTTVAPPTPPPASGPTWFRTPSGNITCMMLDDSARCDISNHNWVSPPTPASCPLDYGDAFELSGAGADFMCHGDTVNGAPDVLPYGSAVRVGPYVCDSATGGVTCRDDQTGHGFFVAIDGYAIF